MSMEIVLRVPGCANTARGAAHFLRETVGRVRYRPTRRRPS